MMISQMILCMNFGKIFQIISDNDIRDDIPDDDNDNGDNDDQTMMVLQMLF